MILNILISGIDEAGRGSVFGPLLIVGLSLSTSNLKKLNTEGLKDSKLFTGQSGRKKRDKLAIKILKIAEDSIIKVIPSIQIDETLARKPYDNLNLLEIRTFFQILKELKTSKSYLDNISSPKYTVNQLRILMNNDKGPISLIVNSKHDDEYVVLIEDNIYKKMRLVVSKRADKKYLVVSAASCVAKYLRDKSLREIEQKYNFAPFSLGQGYPNTTDEKLMSFLEENQEEIRNRKFPFIRYQWKWKVLEDILKKPEKTLDEFF